MIKTGVQMGWLDSEQEMQESLTARRADMIITYFAPDMPKILGKQG